MKLFANPKVVKRKPHTTSIDNLVPSYSAITVGRDHLQKTDQSVKSK